MGEYVYGANATANHPGIEVSVETIDPETARLMLAHNTHNRRLNSRSGQVKYDQLTRAMADGQFDFNGSTVVFAGDGTLLDGQHRLNACVSSGKPFDTIVVRGLPVRSQDTMDSNRVRSVANVLELHGYRNSNVVAAVAHKLLKIDDVGFELALRKNNRVGTTRKQVVSFVERDSELRDCCSKAQNRLKCLLTPSNAGVFLYIMRMIDKDDANAFFQAVCSHDGAYQPCRVLRDVLMADKAKPRDSRMGSYMQAALLCKAWNAFRDGSEVKRLTFRRGGVNPEKFPVPDGFDRDALHVRVSG